MLGKLKTCKKTKKQHPVWLHVWNHVMISIYFQPDWADMNEIYWETRQHTLENGQQEYKVTFPLNTMWLAWDSFYIVSPPGWAGQCFNFVMSSRLLAQSIWKEGRREMCRNVHLSTRKSKSEAWQKQLCIMWVHRMQKFKNTHLW